MALETRPFDVADYLINDRTITAYLTDALQGGEPHDIAQALSDVVRARGGMERMSVETGISLQELEAALSGAGRLDLSTVLKVLRHLGLRLSASSSVREAVAA